MANVMESICMIYVWDIFFGLIAMENKKYVQKYVQKWFYFKTKKNV